jgi:hypothetical protein
MPSLRVALLPWLSVLVVVVAACSDDPNESAGRFPDAGAADSATADGADDPARREIRRVRDVRRS